MEIVNPDILERCPSANFCSVTGGENAPLCGSTPEHLAPLSFAENCCLRALYGVQATVATNERGIPEAATTSLLAWNQLDIAMATKDKRTAETHFAQAALLAGKVLRTTDARVQIIMESDFLATYLPSFRERRITPFISTLIAQRVQLGLAGTYDRLQAAPLHRGLGPRHFNEAGHEPCLPGEEYRDGLSYKVAAALVALRGGVFLYAASPREQSPLSMLDDDAQSTKLPRQTTHDFYLPLDETAKLPIKVRSTKKPTTQGYGTTVRTIYFTNLIHQTLRELVASPARQAKQIYADLIRQHGSKEAVVQAMPDWLAQEVRQPLSEVHTVFLDHVTTVFKQKLIEHRSSFLQTDENNRPLENFSVARR